ncbi:hypothetical protein CPB86DRAFT_734388 [Serendipita vermifera]|nr:hypothetical protein CPB86DRAFT_734388 [Serendipita vermifera]
MATTKGIDPRLLRLLDGPPTLKNLEVMFQIVYATRMFNYAIFTLLVWDMLISLKREIDVVWAARISLVKCLYILNRYLTPMTVALHIWTFSGHAFRLTDTSCRVIYGVATILEIICISSVTLVIAIRLYAMYELTARTLYFLIGLWIVVMVAALLLLIPSLWLHLDDLWYEPSSNICIFIAPPRIWTQLIPRAFEHGFLCAFLIINAMSTPRGSQSQFLAIIYRDGILYYMFTFAVLFTTMMLWYPGDMRYFSITAFMMVPLLTLASSRLLLHMKTAQTRFSTFPSRVPSVASPISEHHGGKNSNGLGPASGKASRTPFDDMSNYMAQSSKMIPSERVASPTAAFILKPMGASVSLPYDTHHHHHHHNALAHARSHSHSREEEEGESRFTDERSRGEHGQQDQRQQQEGEERDCYRYSHHPSIRLHHQYMQRKRWWWILGARDDRPVETRVSIDISPDDMVGMDEQGGNEGYRPRFQVSRLGRYDHWV